MLTDLSKKKKSVLLGRAVPTNGFVRLNWETSDDFYIAKVPSLYLECLRNYSKIHSHNETKAKENK